MPPVKMPQGKNAPGKNAPDGNVMTLLHTFTKILKFTNGFETHSTHYALNTTAILSF